MPAINLRKKVQIDVHKNVSLFWHLSAADKGERLDASVKLVSALEQFQAQFVPSSQAHSDEEEDEDESTQIRKGKQDTLDVLNAQDVSYSIRRLIRGLASPRESSRLGFAVALTELLSRIDTVACTQVVALIMDSSKPQGSMTGQEERDVLFARLFGLMSVIQSRLIVRTGSLHASASSPAEISTLANYKDILSQLVALGEKKSWLRESAWFVVLLGIDVLHDAKVEWRLDAITETVQQIFVEHKIWSPEKIAVGLKMQSLYLDRDWAQIFSTTFKDGDLLNSANLQTLGRILKESVMEDQEDSTRGSGGLWRPQLHFVWQYLLDQYLPGPNSSHAPKGSFQDFFRIVVDESLFSSTSSPQRKYWGFQVFQIALHRIDEEHMPMLFTRNFMRSWINHLSNRDGYLHRIAQQTATEVQVFAKKNPHLGFSLILQLTGVHGSQNFDKLTKTKTLGSAVSSLDTAGVQKYIQWLTFQINEVSATDRNDVQGVNRKRQWTIEQFFSLIRNGSVPKNDEWVQTVLDWLTVHGLFFFTKKSSKSPIAAAQSVAKPPFSDELQKLCRDRLLSCLGELNTQVTLMKTGSTVPLRYHNRDAAETLLGDKTLKVPSVAADGEFWVSKVLGTITTLESDSKHVSILAEADEDDQQLRKRAQKLAEELRRTNGDQPTTARGAELLLLATTLQHYCGHDTEDLDGNSLQACVEGTARMFPDSKKVRLRNVKTDSDGGDPEPVDILVDTIIGFLEKSTAYLRTVANQVFALLSDSVKRSTVELILTQLERRDPTADEMGEEDEEVEMEDIDEDKGGHDMKGEDGETTEGEDGEDDEDEKDEDEGEDEDIDEDIDDEEAIALREKIELALRANGIEPATGDTDSEEEEFMDDDQMMAIDEQLVEVFRSRVNEKKSGSHGAQREATHFKNRVLDLVDTFIKKQPSNPLILLFVSPLVDLIKSTGPDEQQLSDKAKGIFCNRLAPNLVRLSPDVSKELAIKTFKDVHNYSRRVRILSLSTALRQCSLHLIRTLLNLGTEDTVLEAYRVSLMDFCTRKNSTLHLDFFEQFLRRYPEVGLKLRGDILEATNKALNGHRQSQVFQLLDIIINLVLTKPDYRADCLTFLPLLVAKLHDALDAACGERTTLNPTQFKTVLKLGFKSLRLTQQQVPQQLQMIWPADPWASLKTKIGNCKRFEGNTSVMQICEQMIHTMNSSPPGPPQSKKRKLPANQTLSKKRKKIKGGT